MATAAAALLASSMSAHAADKVKFEMWHGLTGDLGEAVGEVCTRFNAAQTEFEIACVTQGSYDAAVNNTIAAFRARKNPTIVQVFDAGTLDLMLSGAFVPAHKLMEDNGYKIDWSNYVSSISDYYATSKGELYSFPFNSSSALLYWNKDAFAKVGETAAPTTWEHVEAVSKKLKAAGYDCPMAINYDTWPILEQFSAIHGQPVATKSNGYAGLDGELVFNKTKFVDYVTFLKAGYDAGIFKLKLPETGATNTQAFAAADCQMMMSSVADHGTVTRTQKAGMSWGVALLPVYEGTKRLNSLVGGASLWVLQGKTAPEYKGAAAFLAFIAKPESELFWSTRTGYIPVTKSGFAFLKGQGFYDNPTYKGRELALESLTASPVNPDLSRGIRLGGFIAIRKEVRDGLQDIFAGNVTVQKGIDGMVERGNVILRRFQQTYANKPLP
jgi:sn-glycerol 3-phosphate transport system substrate-binding protein